MIGCNRRRPRIARMLLLTLSLCIGLVSCRENSVSKNSEVTETDDEDLSFLDDIRPAHPSAPKGTLTLQPPPLVLDAPRFELTDQTGAKFGSSDLEGRVWVANFMFTNCVATCPRQTARLAQLQKVADRWPDRDRVRLVSFTVDPQRDTVAKLFEFAEQYQVDHERWKFLTGEHSQLLSISRDGFKLPVSDGAEDAETPITHSALFAIIDPMMKVRGYYDSLEDKEFERLITDLRAVLAETNAISTQPVHIGIPAEVFAPTWLEDRQAQQLATSKDIKAYHDFQFVDSLESSGIQFVNHAVPDVGRDFKKNHYDHANGVVAADVDGDQLVDLYFVNQVGGNQLWKNIGSAKFENITEAAGVGLPDRISVTATFADADNDGDPDLFVTTTRHGNAFFENDGHGVFKDITKEAGLEYKGHSSAVDFFDFDRDGKLDIFLSNVGVFTTDEIGYSGDREKHEHPYYVGAIEPFAGHLFPDLQEPSMLYHNEGGNRFKDVSEDTGLVEESWTGDVTPIDVNNDGWLDLYVLNMQGNDEYYENIEGQRFERKSEVVFYDSVWGGMGVKSFDYNNDGLMDLFVTDMHADMWQLDKNINGPDEKKKPPLDVMSESYLRSRNPDHNILGNALYKNTGQGFEEVSDRVNLETYWPWGPSVADLNADGFQDVFITSCMNYRFRYHVNKLMLNELGERFRDAEFILGVEPRGNSQTAAPWFELDGSGADAAHELCEGRPGKIVVWGAIGSRSSVIFDIEGDGDLDIVTNDFNTAPMVLVSDLAARNSNLHYLKIRLQGTRSNHDGLGAKVQVAIGQRVLTQVHDGQSGYLSQSSLPLYFGLDDAAVIDNIRVQWPNGEQQVLQGPIAANQQLTITEP